MAELSLALPLWLEKSSIHSLTLGNGRAGITGAEDLRIGRKTIADDFVLRREREFDSFVPLPKFNKVLATAYRADPANHFSSCCYSDFLLFSSPRFPFLKARIFMNLHRFKQAAVMVTALLLISSATAQEQAGDKVDLDALAQIKNEAYQHSQVMENLYYMSEVYGPRVTNSRNHRAAAEWAMQQMKDWGLKNVHLEKWPFGYGWQIKHFYAAMETPVYAAFTGFPLAWTPGTNGPITVEPVWAPIHSKADPL